MDRELDEEVMGRGRRHIDGDTGDRGLLCQSVNVRRNLTKGCHLCHQRLTQKLNLKSIIMFSLHHVAITRLFGDFS